MTEVHHSRGRTSDTRNAHLFPRFHVRPPAGYINDPNGPLVVDGVVHLYFQRRLDVDPASPVRWGHVTSTDLVHWRDEPAALEPHPLLGDRDGCWSGNTVLDGDGAVRAFYSGYVRGEPLQRTLASTSADGGRTFGPPRQVVPAPGADEGVTQLRDPFVWREDGRWHMVLGAGTEDDAAQLRRYESTDLDRWSYCGVLAALPRTCTRDWDSGAMWECPQILGGGSDLVAVVGSWGLPDGVMHSLSMALPTLDGDARVSAQDVHLVDHGPNFYAASILRDPALFDDVGGPLLWAWATEGRAEAWARADGWSGMLTLPRAITAHPDGRLSSVPLPGLAALRTHQAGREPDTGSSALSGLGPQLEFLLQVDHRAGALTVRLRFGAQEHLDVVVDGRAGLVVVDRERASTDDRAHGGSVTLRRLDVSEGSADIRGFVDGSILELFLPDGRVATTRFYPTSPPPWRLELIGATAAARLVVWELGSAEVSTTPG